jgi:LuxR family maltose regulon positive regulatory protein
VETASAPLDVAEGPFADAASEPFEPSVGWAASLLANVPAAIALARAYLAVLHGDAKATAASASRALAALGDGEWVLRSASVWILAIAEWVRGRLENAERGFAASAAGWRAAGQPPLAAWACFDLSRVQRARGRLDARVVTCQQVVEITTPGGAPTPAAGIGYVGMAEVAYQRNELDTALRYVIEGIPLCRQLNWKTQPLAAGLVTLAWIRQANGDPGGAREAIAEAERVAPSPTLANLFNPVPAQRARLLLAQGDTAAAARWAAEGGLRADDEPMYQTEREHLVLARVLLAQDQPGKALAMLDRLHAAAAAQDRAGSLIEIGALRALALAASADADRAVNALAEALTLACPQGYVRVFADEGPPMAALLARLIAAQRSGGAVAEVPLGCLARLQRALAAQDLVPGGVRSGVTAVPGLVEQLTRRELEVLEMLAAGRSNQAIASQLVVTLDTVKKHVSHVLGKLGAANRTEAVARARELSLIP